MKHKLTKEIIYSVLKQHQEVLKNYGVNTIGLFGSFRHGNADDKSDIDFLVEFEPTKKTFRNFMDLIFFLEEKFQRKVEVVTPQGLSPYLRPSILNTVEYVSLPG